MKWSIERSVTIGYGVTLALVVAVGIVSYWTTAGFIDASNTVAHRYEDIEALDQILSDLKDAAASGLSYLATGEQAYLLDYGRESQTARLALPGLDRLREGNAEQERILQELKANVSGHFTLLDQGVNVRSKGVIQPGVVETLTKESRSLMATNQVLIGKMKAEQSRLLRQRSEEAEMVANKTTTMAMVGSFLTLLIVSWAILIINRDLNERRKAAEEREKLIAELQEALANIKTLGGLLPICAWCKKIRDDKGYWNQVDAYITQHTAATFSHGLCPECMRKMNDELQELKGGQGGSA